MVVADCEPDGAGFKAAEDFFDCLLYGFQCLETVAAFCGVYADALGGAMRL